MKEGTARVGDIIYFLVDDIKHSTKITKIVSYGDVRRLYGFWKNGETGKVDSDEGFSDESYILLEKSASWKQKIKD